LNVDALSGGSIPMSLRISSLLAALAPLSQDLRQAISFARVSLTVERPAFSFFSDAVRRGRKATLWDWIHDHFARTRIRLTRAKFQIVQEKRMDDTVAKSLVSITIVVIGAILQLPAVTKAWIDLRHSRRDRRKRESEFATAFARQCGDPNVTRYAEELGYAALVGDANLTIEERKVLLSFQDLGRTVDRFLQAQHWIKPDVSERRLKWKRPRHEQRWYRAVAMTAYLIGYVCFASIAFSPITLHEVIFLKTAPLGFAVAVLVWTMCCGMPLAILCLHGSISLRESARLIAEHRLFEDGSESTPACSPDEILVPDLDGHGDETLRASITLDRSDHATPVPLLRQ
jgi:hypothetical protein